MATGRYQRLMKCSSIKVKRLVPLRLLQELLSKQVELIQDGDARHAKCLTQVDNFVQILKDNQVCVCQVKQTYEQEKKT